MKEFLATSGILLLVALPASALTLDFAESDHGFFQQGDGQWDYDGTAWVAEPVDDDYYLSDLISPTFTVGTAGAAEFLLSHAYASASGQDGGVVFYALNGSSLRSVVPQGGYPVQGFDNRGCEALAAPCFGGNSGGTVQSTFSISGLDAGDTLAFMFQHGSESGPSSKGVDWTLYSLALTNLTLPAIPIPPALPMFAGALGLLWWRGAPEAQTPRKA
ncbi:MAG: hypothetical protein AAGF71_02060 [Pseudomonadota bacterium]